MKLLIHDYTPEEWTKQAENHKDCTVISETGPIRPCIGCFACWTRGKGECVFKDGYEKTGQMIHEADELFIISRYTYGGVSPFVKNVFDRMIGYVLPEFETVNGEMHHRKRYAEDKPVTFCFRGCALSEEQKENARRYAYAVCRNLRGHVKNVLFEEYADQRTDNVIRKETAVRSGILLVDCSLRGNRSNTNVFLHRVKAHLDPSVKLMSLSEETPEEIAEAFGNVKTALIGMPLFVDGMPSHALRLLEMIRKNGAGKGCRVYALVHNGLYESRQNENLLHMIREWCEAAGCLYHGALAIGASEAIGTLMRSKHPLWPVHNAQKGIMRLAEAMKEDLETEEIHAAPFLFPRWLYIRIANANWQLLKKQKT